MTAILVKTCKRCAVEKDVSEFYKSTGSPDGFKPLCKACWKAGDKRDASDAAPRSRRSLAERIMTDSGYVASGKLLRLWHVVRTTRRAGDPHPMQLLFTGPSGSGKTEAAKYLAQIADLPFTKVDAPSIVDAEAWFGVRELIAQDGVSVTKYTPSDFVLAVTRPGVLFIDEINRISDPVRNNLLGLFDGTHRITNPLTGEIVEKHPDCYVIMAGNRGLQFTGTFPIDPALLTRSLIEKFSYLQPDDETAVAIKATISEATPNGVDKDVAALFVRFASETRSRSKTDPEMNPISTREVIAACLLVAGGYDIDDAAATAIVNGANDEGGVGSVAYRLQQIWGGIRPKGDKATTAFLHTN